MADERFSTGVAGLDEVLDGGVYHGVNILVSGATGTGKTTVSLQFLVQGAREGQKGMYLTFEESSEQIIKYGSKFFPDLREHVDNGIIQIMDFSPHHTYHDREKVVGDEKVTIPSKERVDSIAYVEDKILDIRGQTIKRVVIDGLQTFATTFYDLSGQKDVEELRRTVSKIMVLLKKEDITTYTLSEKTGDEDDKYGFINFTVDGVIELKVNEALDMRTVKVIKMRGIDHTLKPLVMQLAEGEGVVVQGQQKRI